MIVLVDSMKKLILKELWPISGIIITWLLLLGLDNSKWTIFWDIYGYAVASIGTIVFIAWVIYIYKHKVDSTL